MKRSSVFLMVVLAQLLGAGACPPPPPKPKALTVVDFGAKDLNGFSLNPIWGYQWNNKMALPKVSDVCPDYNKATDWTRGLDSCTEDTLSVDTQKTHDQYCMPGHYNWFPVAYEGTIYWSDHSQGRTIFQFGGDDDYNVLLVGHDHNLFTVDNPGSVEGEFDSDETVDWWGKGCDPDNDWWQCFHDAVDAGDPYTVAHQKMDGHYALAIGLLGIDGNNYHAYNSAQSELHPLWALLIHVAPGTTDDTWAFFVRNSGDEGYCGNSQHVFTTSNDDVQKLALPIPAPQGATGMTFLPSTKVNASPGVPPTTHHVPMSWSGGANGARITVYLYKPQYQSWVEGELHISWQAPAGVKLAPVEGPSGYTRMPAPGPSAEATEEPAPPEAQKTYAALSPAARQEYVRRVAALVQPQKAEHYGAADLNAAFEKNPPPVPTMVHVATLPNPRYAEQQQARLRVLEEVRGTMGK